MRLTRLGIAVAASITLQVVGAVLAIQQRLAYGFGGHGDPNQVARDFVLGGGTAESPSVVFLVLLVLAAVLAAVRGRVGVIACVAVSALSVLEVIGFLGEPHTWRTFSLGSLEPGWAAYELLALASLVAMFLLAVRELAVRRRLQPTAHDAERQPKL
ncbi:MAG: hypothetical protein E6J02_04875 [Chloroflexi bacterium]|nr:MAG: hypothetical protein E6J02_04875 [Chloroflexota bacterium]TME14784.1 MAG: hypothetical protein E6I70_14820 [Chloroflexota bacterium]TME18453.1 MAG: hypothetical protein E6I63_01290 [Chloroflexota bacterium]